MPEYLAGCHNPLVNPPSPKRRREMPDIGSPLVDRDYPITASLQTIARQTDTAIVTLPAECNQSTDGAGRRLGSH
jgi:hypothetical protein